MPAPNLTGQTAEALRTTAFAKWETLSNEPATVGTPEFLMLELLSFLAALNNTAIQQGLEGSLINYSLGERLDEIGVLFGLSRRPLESDTDYRTRIMLAPAEFTTAGTEEQIKAIVKGVDLSITDVAATVTTAPNVSVRFITKTGLPSATLIAKVLAKLQDKRVKPVCVAFTVSAPTVINYSLAASITTYADADITTIPARCATALNDYIKVVRSSMGRDVVLAQIVGVLQNVEGVYKAVITSPTADLIVLPTEWATAPDATPASITLAASVAG